MTSTDLEHMAMNDTRHRVAPTLTTLPLALMAAALVAACGGGNGNGTDSPATADIPTVTDTTSPTPAANSDEPALEPADASPTIGQSLEERTSPSSSLSSTTSATAATVADIPGGVGVYVDAATGNDGNPGTQALPWRSLAKLVDVRLSTGQGVYLKCGSTWRESVMLDGRQFTDGTIISGYGPCLTTKAVITGAADLSTGWVKYGSVWQRTLPAGTPKITRLFIGGVPQRTAQWPNYGGVGKEYALAKADMAKSSTVLAAAVADMPTLTGKDLVGATAIVKSEPWIVETRTIAAADAAGNLTLNAPTTYGMEGGDGYILQDKFWMLNSVGEFFHDTARNLVLVWPSDPAAQLNLNAAKVEGTVRDTGLHLRNRTGLSVRHIAFTRTKSDGLLMNDTPNAVIDTVSADDNGARGLRFGWSGGTAPNPSGSVVRNSSFARNGMIGVDAGNVSGVSITGSVFTDTGMSPHAGNADAAIAVGAGGLAEKNVVRNSALAGIRFSGTGGTRVLGNLVENSCIRFSDGAAIKTWNGTKNWVNQSSLVEGNTIVRVTGNSEGSVGGAADWSAGIYLDDFTRGVTLRSNFVSAANVGIMVHNASNNVIEYNRVALATKTPLFANMDKTDADYMTNNVYRFNQWSTPGTSTGAFPALPTPTAPQAVIFWHSLHGAAALGAGKNYFTGNEFVLPSGSSAPAATIRSNTTLAQLTVQDWLRSNPEDTLNATTPQYRTSQMTMGSNLIPLGGFDSGLAGWITYAANVTPRGTLGAGTRTGCTGTCALMASGSVSDSLNSPNFNMVVGGLYSLAYTTVFANDGTLNRPGIGRAATPHDTFMASRISTSASKGIAGSVLSQETYFTASSSEAAYLTLGAAASTQVAFDNVSLRQVFGYTLAKVSEWVSYAYASPMTASTVDCPTLGWPAGCAVTDLSGRAVPLPTNLPAGSAAVYLRADSAWRAP